MSNGQQEAGKRLAVDLVALLNRFKLREERHRQLLLYNNAIIARSEQLEQSIFIQDDINQFQKHHTDKSTLEKTDTAADHTAMLEYELDGAELEGAGAVVRRSLGRAVEMAGHSVEQMKEPVEYYRWYFARFKLVCLRSTQENTLVKPSHAIRLVSTYATHRMGVELGRLAAIVHCLQMSDYDGLRALQSEYYQTMHKGEHARLP